MKIERCLELFAAHPEHGTLRVDYCGALAISGTKPVAVEGSRIVFESGSAYRNKTGQVWGVPVWDFAKRGAGRGGAVAARNRVPLLGLSGREFALTL